MISNIKDYNNPFEYNYKEVKQRYNEHGAIQYLIEQAGETAEITGEVGIGPLEKT